jgi:predicted transcriptional regulator
VSELTPAQEAVLRLRAEGLTMKDVAARLGVSEQTVKNHSSAAYEAMDVDNIIGAMMAKGWVQIPGQAERCGYVAQCTRWKGHRGHHGGFRAQSS